MSLNKNNYVIAINRLLTSVVDKQMKLMFLLKLQTFTRQNDKNKIFKLFNDVTNYLSINDDDKIEPTYDTPPTFDKAVNDFLSYFNKNVDSLPDVTPLYAEYIEKNKKNNGKGGKKGGKKNDDDATNRIDNIEMFVKSGVLLCHCSCQGGKGNFTIACAIKSMINGRTPIIITRNFTGDANKMDNDIGNVSKLFSNFMDKNNVKKKFEITTLRCEKLDSEKLHKSLNGQYPRIVVCLANSIQIKKLYDVVSESKSAGLYDLYIDEVDFIDCGNSELSENLNNLKNYAFQTYGITATPLDFILSETELKTANSVLLKPHPEYRSYQDFLVHTLDIDPDVTALNTKATYEEILTADKNLKPYLNEFLVSRLGFAHGLGKYHPNICLIKNTILNENQDALFNGIIKDYGKDIAVVVFNGNGIAMHFDGMKSVIIKKTLVKPKKYYNLEIPDVIQFFKSDEEKFKRIIIISGLTTGRCVSLVSRDYEWHLTDMYYVPSASTPVPELIQSAGRLCGRNKGKSHLILNCTLKVAKALYNGLNFTYESLYRAVDEYKDSEDSLKESMMKIPMERKKLPVGRNLTTKVKLNKNEFNLVKENDGGFDIESYKFNRIIREIKENKDKNIEIVNDIEEIGVEEYNRLTKKMFPKWSVGNTKISNFMKNLDPNKEYTDKEMKELCKNFNITDFSHLLTYNRIISKGYGKIISKKENRYFLSKCLVSEFIKYF